MSLNQPTMNFGERFPASGELSVLNEQGKQEIWQLYNLRRPAVLMFDPYTGITFTTSLPFNEYDTAAHTAWVGTRHSRAPEHTMDIRAQIESAGVDPDGKLKQFLGIGHTAPGDAAKLSIELDQLPRHLAHLLFEMSPLVSGQEKSTRYQQGFLGKPLTPLMPFLGSEVPVDLAAEIEMQYQALGNYSLSASETAKNLILPVFGKFYGIDSEKKKEVDIMISRILDCARVLLLLGQNTGMSVVTSARELSKIIGTLKAFPGNYYSHFAQQLENFLAPNKEVQDHLGYRGEAAQLIRHTEPITHNVKNILALNTYLLNETSLKSIIPDSSFAGSVDQGVLAIPPEIPAGYRFAAQYILCCNPDIAPMKVINWLMLQPDEVIGRISQIILNHTDVYHELPHMAATTNMSLVFEANIAVNRDFARHRGGAGRFQPVPTWNGIPMDYEAAKRIINTGYILPIHLTQVEEFQSLVPVMNELLQGYYERLSIFIDRFYSTLGNDIDYGFIMNLLPLAHKMPMWMHFHPAQAVFFPDRRLRPGGDHAYRQLAWDANKLLSRMDPMLGGMLFPADREPNFRDREEFLDRA